MRMTAFLQMRKEIERNMGRKRERYREDEITKWGKIKKELKE